MPRSFIFLLTAIAGYVDTATYFHMSGLFAAHVTGNIVVFAAALARGLNPEDYLKLWSFPLFLISVGCAVIIYTRASQFKNSFGVAVLIFLQGVILLAASVAALYLRSGYDVLISMSMIFAMGLQNALHRFVPGPMSTVMTGNVMNWAASLTEKLFGITKPENPHEAEIKKRDNKIKPPTGWMIFGFASGSAISAFATREFGMASCIVPALVAITLGFVQGRRQMEII